MSINTTCPADQQIEGSDDFTDEEIKTLIAFDPVVVEPCPVAFHLARVHITRLRVAVAHNTITDPSTIILRVLDAFNSIWEFDLERWIEEEFADKNDDAKHQVWILALIHGLAIRLYGILTLPRWAVAAWGISSPKIKSAYPAVPGCGTYESLRRRHRDALLKMLLEQWSRVESRRRLAWPFAVVGVAVANTDVATQRYVERCLFTIWKDPEVTTSSISALEKLRVFWLSGKTEWEDCYNEPIPFACSV